jgi:hypothetical protein
MFSLMSFNWEALSKEATSVAKESGSLSQLLKAASILARKKTSDDLIVKLHT